MPKHLKLSPKPPSESLLTLPSVALGVDSNVHIDPQNFLETKGPLILPGTIRSVYFTSSIPLRLTYFRVNTGSARHFLIHALQVARMNSIVGSNPIPASAYNEHSPPLDSALLPSGAIGLVQVENISQEPQRFLAMFFGLDLTSAASAASAASVRTRKLIARPRAGQSDPKRTKRSA